MVRFFTVIGGGPSLDEILELDGPLDNAGLAFGVAAGGADALVVAIFRNR